LTKNANLRLVPSLPLTDKQKKLRAIIFENFDKRYWERWEFLEKRLGLKGKEPMTYQEIGDWRGVSREWVRLNVSAGIDDLRLLFDTGKNSRCQIEESLFIEIKNWHQSLKAFEPVMRQSQIIQHTENFFDTQDFDTGLLRLLLMIFGYQSFSLDDETIWVNDVFDGERLKNLLSISTKYLKNLAESRNLEDILQAISKDNQAAPYTLTELEAVLSIAPAIEQLQDGQYQLKFENLVSVAAKAYRLLYQREDTTPFAIKEIDTQLRQAMYQAKLPPNSIRRILGAVSKDERFQHIGKTGKWVLTKWHYAPSSLLSVPKIIEEAIIEAKHPLTYQEIRQAVSRARPADIDNTGSALSQNRFVKLMDGRYTLRTLADPAQILASPKPEPKPHLRKERLALAIKKVFEAQELTEMPLKNLYLELIKQLPEYRATQIWRGLVNPPNLAISISGVLQKRIATFRPDFENEIETIDLLANGERSPFVQEMIRELLREKGQMRLKDLIEEIGNRCNILPRNVYHYVTRLKGEIIHGKDTEGFVICKLVE
jgi:hypothetical protein